MLSLHKISAVSKKKVVDTFAIKEWKSLTVDQQKSHSLANCKGCLGDKNYNEVLSLFPIKKNDKAGLKKKLLAWER